jgi:dienelactone hydrolase
MLAMLAVQVLLIPGAARAVRHDPPAHEQPPASAEEIGIDSGGHRLNGLLYLPGGAGPHPVVIFLHGYPGNERNLDLAQAVRRAGYAALYFDYRGDFGSGGVFSHAHSLEDAAAVLAWTRSPAIVAKYRLDPARIAVVGHSDGGWLSLFSVARERANVCVAAIAAWNVGWAASRYASHPDERAADLEYFRATNDVVGGPVHASPEDLMKEAVRHATDWNYVTLADTLKDRSLLLVAGTRDTPNEGVDREHELAAAIRKGGGTHVQMSVFDDDESFSSHRIVLAETLTRWLRGDCARSQSRP